MNYPLSSENKMYKVQLTEYNINSYRVCVVYLSSSGFFGILPQWKIDFRFNWNLSWFPEGHLSTEVD
jgi:hypothetical protein